MAYWTLTDDEIVDIQNRQSQSWLEKTKHCVTLADAVREGAIMYGRAVEKLIIEKSEPVVISKQSIDYLIKRHTKCSWVAGGGSFGSSGDGKFQDVISTEDLVQEAYQAGQRAAIPRLSEDAFHKAIGAIKPGDGWDGTQWDLAIAEAVRDAILNNLATYDPIKTEKLELALKAITEVRYECGCKPCYGDCKGPEANEAMVDEMHELAEEALKEK